MSGVFWKQPFRLRDQSLKDSPLARPKIDWMAIDERQGARMIDSEISDSDNGSCLTLGAAKECPNSCFELAWLKGLKQIIVGSKIEAFDPIVDRVSRSKDQHRRLEMSCPRAPQDLETVEFRQANIERDKRVGFR